jgi:predicted RNA-binding protein with PIN domain
MHYLIDGYNLMHAAGLMKLRFGPGGLEKARRALLGVLAGSLAQEATQATVVFDARTVSTNRHEAESSTSSQGIRVEFAASAETADERIEKLIRIESAPKQLTVVSSDAQIRTAAERRGARPVASDTFWEQLISHRRRRVAPPDSAAGEKPGGRGTRENEFWQREFEGLISEEELRELAGPFGDAP